MKREGVRGLVLNLIYSIQTSKTRFEKVIIMKREMKGEEVRGLVLNLIYSIQTRKSRFEKFIIIKRELKREDVSKHTHTHTHTHTDLSVLSTPIPEGDDVFRVPNREHRTTNLPSLCTFV